MDEKLKIALNNLWIILRNAKLSGVEHDQLRDDFVLIRETIEAQTKETKNETK